jgi:hypothetical protein
MTLVDQWHTIEADLPPNWEDVRLTLTTEQPGDLARAAQVLGPITVGKVGSTLVFTVRRGGGHQSPEAATRLFGRLDRERTWCLIQPSQVQAAPAATVADAGLPSSLVEGWDTALAPLPSDWTDLLCELELESSDYLDRAALLCAPLNPTRDATRLAFTFRCSGRSGYGVAPSMARRCFERLDQAQIVGTTRVLRVVSDTNNVDTQGPVWLVGGKNL